MFKLVSLGSVLQLISALAPCGLNIRPSDQVIAIMLHNTKNCNIIISACENVP